MTVAIAVQYNYVYLTRREIPSFFLMALRAFLILQILEIVSAVSILISFEGSARHVTNVSRPWDIQRS